MSNVTVAMRCLLNNRGWAFPLPLGALPTPVEHLPSLGSQLGIKLFLKREDRIDDLGCGNKVRKLSYVFADAVMKKATVLLTAGSVPSNQCKAVAALAPRVN